MLLGLDSVKEEAIILFISNSAWWKEMEHGK